MAEKNSAQTNRQTDRQTNRQTNTQTDRHYENNGHLAVNQLLTATATTTTLSTELIQVHELPAVLSYLDAS